jgi:hypothetical protein
MIIQVYACLSFNSKGIYTLRLETGQNGVYKYTWEGQLCSYCSYLTIILLSFMQKRCKIGVKEHYWWNIGACSLHLYEMSTNQITPRELHFNVRLHLYRKQWKTGSYTWAFLDTEGATISTLCDTTKAAKLHGLKKH